MPVKNIDVTLHEYPMSSRGVNLYKSLVDLSPQECILSQNLIFRNGMVKRGGQSKFETDEVAAGKAICGLHRFYYGSSSKLLLTASGTKIKYHDGATWQPIDAVIGQSQTDGAQTTFATWGALNKVYIANGVNAPIKYDGTTATLLNPTNYPQKAIQFLPYQDRLLAIDANNEGNLTWSASFSDTSAWQTAAACGVKPDTKLYGMVHHSVTNITSGYEAQVLLAGANGMYLFSGTSLTPPFTVGDYIVSTLATTTGCSAPRTMCWTPAGTIWFGIDKQVYLLPFKSNTPIPIGHKIWSNYTETEGIESIPSAYMSNACAVYHKGYYILSVPRTGQTINNAQWWLDVSRLQQDEDGLWGPWYGPMLGQTISCFATQNGTGDSGELMAGEGKASIGSYVYEVNKSGVYDDNGTSITCMYKTYYNPMGAPAFIKDVHRMEIELLDVLGSINIDCYDISGSIKMGDVLNLSNQAIYWNDKYWGEDYWSSSSPVRVILPITPAIPPRRLSVLLKHTSNADKFELYGLRVEAIEQSQVFGA